MSISASILAIIAIFRVSQKDIFQGSSPPFSLHHRISFRHEAGSSEGTGLVWSYPNFNIYTYMDIPLAIILSWGWWMVLCYMLSIRIRRIFDHILSTKRLWLASPASFFLSGVVFALIIEPVALFLGYWHYLDIGQTVLFFPFINVGLNASVIGGWGILTTINLTFSSETAASLAAKINRSFHLGSLRAVVVSSALLGLFNGWFSWQLIYLLSKLRQNASPRIFFTKDEVITLSWITSTQLVAILILASITITIIWRRNARHQIPPWATFKT